MSWNQYPAPECFSDGKFSPSESSASTSATRLVGFSGVSGGFWGFRMDLQETRHLDARGVRKSEAPDHAHGDVLRMQIEVCSAPLSPTPEHRYLYVLSLSRGGRGAHVPQSRPALLRVLIPLVHPFRHSRPVTRRRSPSRFAWRRHSLTRWVWVEAE